jgi:hypothetical protein
MAGLADTFPESLPAFQRMFPDDRACALYLESVRWRDGFACPRCNGTAEPMRLGRPHLLRCRNCKLDPDNAEPFTIRRLDDAEVSP